MNTDYPLPPPIPTDAGGRVRPARSLSPQGDQAVPAINPPPEGPASPPQDDVHLSPLLGGNEKMGRDVKRAIQEFQTIAQQPLPLAEKMARLTDVLQKAAGPLNLKGDDRSLCQIRNAAGEIMENLIQHELRNIQGSKDLSTDQKQQHLKQMGQHVKDLSWLAEGFQSSIEVDLAFAQADLMLGRP